MYIDWVTVADSNPWSLYCHGPDFLDLQENIDLDGV